MRTTKTKTISFIVEDISSVNKIMGQRGTLYVEAVIESVEIDEERDAEYKGEYAMKWSSSFEENEPYAISNVLHSKVVELFLNSEFDEGEAFALEENITHNLSHFEKYDIGYMTTHDCVKVESLIKLAAQAIVGAGVTEKGLDVDAVDKLASDIKLAFNKREGNLIDEEMSEDKMMEFANMLENGETVEFTHAGCHYEIFESSESGYAVNVYSHNERDEDGDYLDKYIIDGGLCSGSARDAVGFML